MGNLYVIATPIGNLGDTTARGVEVLKKVDTILCEDTRRASKMIAAYEIKKPLLSFHHHSKQDKFERIMSLLEEGKDLAMVSDAGTPGISDPGGALIKAVVVRFGNMVNIVPIPGPSALTTAISVSGFPADKFLFLGFPPSKNKRKRFFDEIVKEERMVVIYESPHRIVRTMRDLMECNGEREAIVGRELTKKFETIYRGTVKSIFNEIEKHQPKGEFVIVLK